MMKHAHTQTHTGISLRSQLLYMCVFLTRYIDLLTVFVSWYAHGALVGGCAQGQ